MVYSYINEQNKRQLKVMHLPQQREIVSLFFLYWKKVML